jgi:flagellar hook-basal body complex protein FliE
MSATVAAVAPVTLAQPNAAPVEATPLPTAAEDVDFESVLRGAVERVNAADQTAIQRVEALAAGATDDLHGTMISVKEAEIGVKLVGSVRNKLLDAFHELWRTSV